MYQRSLRCVGCIIAVAIAFICFANAHTFADDVAALQELASPGPEHAQLAARAGAWKLTIRMFAGPQPIELTGTATNEMLVGGRFLQSTYKAAGGGFETEGVFTTGFDRRHGEHTMILMDNFGTYFVTARGKAPAEGEELKLLGKDDDPQMTALGLTKEFAFAPREVDDDHYVVEIRFIDTRTPERKEIKFMEYDYQRAPE
jgi:hypothetical protein